MAAAAAQAGDLERWHEGPLQRALISASPALLHGLRLTASVCLALFIAFWLKLDNAHWAGTSAAIVAQPALGASLRKGQFRAIGTFVGGVLIVLLTAAFPQEHGALLLGLTVWAAVCAFLTALLRNFAGYGAALAGYTAILVFAGIIENPQNVFMVSVWRVSEISIGIFSVIIVHSLTDFGDARSRLQRTLSELGSAIASGIVRTLQTGEDDLPLRTARRAMIGRVIALDPTIDEAIGEPSHLRHCRSQLRGVLESLFIALSAWRAMANHLALLPAPRRALLLPTLLPSMVALADCVASDAPGAVLELCATGSRRLAQMPSSDLSGRVLNESLARIFHAFEILARGLLLVSTPTTQCSVGSRTRLHVPDSLPGMLDALRTFLAIAAVELFWVSTSWPQGPTMMVFTAIGVMLFARQSDAAYSSALEFAIGCTIATAVAAILLFAVLPLMQGSFFMLAAALALFLLPLGALSAGSWHRAVFVAAVTNVIPVLAIQNDTSYDAARLFNLALVVVAGTVAPALFFRLLPPLSPQRRTQRLLMLTLRDLRGLLLGQRRFSQDDWRGLLSHRLAAMPKQATLEDEAELLAALSVGEACITLIATPPTSVARNTLDRALACLAHAQVVEAHDALARFAAAQVDRQPDRDTPGIDAAIQATLIADALQRHGRFFSLGA